ncbi:glycoside hydrolase family 47 protein [Lasiosphaeria ovina]|uniref:alpha-1,2-Mannosidase n=1 Tax=Lasiosphaeria ovina TaxID=92902 RepID=A0AAE0NLL3_9PEZI|nr:glycoside hydrolase family 47 protein [Lasiosphaeria ovina]
MAFITVPRRLSRLALAVVLCLATIYFFRTKLDEVSDGGKAWGRSWGDGYVRSSFNWATRLQTHPIPEANLTRLPQGAPRVLPRIQHQFSELELDAAHNKTQQQRRDAVRRTATKCWEGYRQFAWGRDELSPLTQTGADTFAGWGATAFDSLDTLWIMGLTKEFKQAVRLVAAVDWDRTTSGHCSLFETTIRYLGGLLAAYDLSHEKVLLGKALELGNMLYAAFDTPSHMPANDFRFGKAKQGGLVADRRESLATIGSLSLEFTRLSQLTGDPKYYSVVDRIKLALEQSQDDTNLPGMWPTWLDLQHGFHASDTSFTLGASADSAYEYLSKTYALLGGLDQAYEKMHLKAMATARDHVLFRPMLPDAYPAALPDILFSGTVLSNGRIIELLPEVQHLGCFAGGMFALGGRLFQQDGDVKIGEQLARGCAWAYDAFPTGVMPEVTEILPCERKPINDDENRDADDPLAHCAWNQSRWGDDTTSPKPFSNVRDPQYLLRPEAIESIFVLYRITGKKDLLDVAWRMFQAVTAATETEHAHAAITDVQVTGTTGKTNSMESFWIAETLKYFYLIFSDPDLISLDDYVFNTEAHPLRIPKPPPPTGVKES